MSWPLLTILTVIILFGTIIYVRSLRRRARLEAEQPYYLERLRTERDSLLFVLYFTLFWLTILGPRIDWTFAGQYSGAVIAVSLGLLLHVVRWIYRRLDWTRSSEDEE